MNVSGAVGNNAAANTEKQTPSTGNPMMRSHRKIYRLLVAASLFAGPLLAALPVRAAFIDLTPTSGVNSTNSVLLSDLIAGTNGVTGITVGDKIFSGFNYSFLGDMPNANMVQVLGFKDGDGNWGVSFHGAFVDMPGGSSSDAAIRFNVDIDPTFLQRGYRISDAHLFLSGSGVGSDSVFTVDESFLGLNNTLHAFMSSLGSGGTQLSDSTDFNPTVPTLHVTKDIFANASSLSFLPARATVIDQSFSQSHPIPEPAVATLSLLGMVGFGLKRKRQID
jgi:hypothetical protein